MTKIKDELNDIIDSKMTTILANAKRMEMALRHREISLQHQRTKAKSPASEKKS